MLIFSKQSKYQLIELKSHALYPDEYVLRLDNSWQLSTENEFRYHESLVTIPLAVASQIKKVLICGGGDGMSVREAVKYNDLDNVTLAEIDGDVIDLFKNGFGKKLNKNSLNNNKTNIHIGDAVSFAETKNEKYNVVILDFPSPTSDNKTKNYPNLFAVNIWEKFLNLLPEDGLLVSQVSIKSRLLANLVKHLLLKGYFVWYWDTAYSGRGNADSFLAASKTKLKQERSLPFNCRFATDQRIKTLFTPRQELTTDDLEYYRLFHFCDFLNLDREERDNDGE
jgi:predicted membrane-bound spermidine synthase